MSFLFHNYLEQDPIETKPRKCYFTNCNNVEGGIPNPDALSQNKFKSVYCCPKHSSSSTVVHKSPSSISQPVEQAPNQPPKGQSVKKETCRITADTQMNEICRLCLKSIDITTDKSFVPIFGQKTVTLNRYQAVVEPSQLITNFTWISEMELQHSLFPQQICKNCFQNLCAMDKFRKMCEKAHETLRKAILKDEKQNDEFNELIEIEMDSDYKDDVNVDANNDVDGIVEESEPVKEPSKPIIPYLLPQECSLCLDTFDNCEELKYHRMSRHSGKNYTFIYKCYVNNCKKIYKTIGRLQEHHKNSHPVGLSFRCEICKKVFFNKTSFQNHIRRHGERKHNCNTCGKSFVGRGHLVNHQLVHNGQRNFVCDICSKTFKRPYAMRVHKRIHTNEKPFICHLCGEAFTYKCLMKTHLEKYHPNEPIEKTG